MVKKKKDQTMSNTGKISKGKIKKEIKKANRVKENGISSLTLTEKDEDHLVELLLRLEYLKDCESGNEASWNINDYMKFKLQCYKDERKYKSNPELTELNNPQIKGEINSQKMSYSKFIQTPEDIDYLFKKENVNIDDREANHSTPDEENADYEDNDEEDSDGNGSGENGSIGNESSDSNVKEDVATGHNQVSDEADNELKSRFKRIYFRKLVRDHRRLMREIDDGRGGGGGSKEGGAALYKIASRIKQFPIISTSEAISETHSMEMERSRQETSPMNCLDISATIDPLHRKRVAASSRRRSGEREEQPVQHFIRAKSASQSANIRILFKVDSSHSIIAGEKLLVVNRSISLEELMSLARSKCQASTKYDLLTVSIPQTTTSRSNPSMVDRRPLTQMDLLELPNDSHVLLGISTSIANQKLMQQSQMGLTSSSPISEPTVSENVLPIGSSLEMEDKPQTHADPLPGLPRPSNALEVKNQSERQVSTESSASNVNQKEVKPRHWVPPDEEDSEEEDGIPSWNGIPSHDESNIKVRSIENDPFWNDLLMAQLKRLCGQLDGSEYSATLQTICDGKCPGLLESHRIDPQAVADYGTRLLQRHSLPIHTCQEEILHHLHHASSPFLMISGETGSGKTTQVCQMVLDDMIQSGRGSQCFILVTQPRRIAAISLAERVCQERTPHRKVGEDLIGYQIRLKNRSHPVRTRILFCTTGVLLRKLQRSDFLKQVSHIIMDEVHERQVESDFFMNILKQTVPSFPHLKLILMSATMQENLFASYFHDCPIVSVQGRSHPVHHHHLPDIHSLLAESQQFQHGWAAATATGAVRPTGKRDIGSSHRRKCLDDFIHCTKRFSLGQKGPGPGAETSKEVIVQTPQFDAEMVSELIVRIVMTFHISAMASEYHLGPEDPSDGSVRRKGQAILVFLSGKYMIDELAKVLRKRDLQTSLNLFFQTIHEEMGSSQESSPLPYVPIEVQVLSLHGSLPIEQQRQVFRRTRPGQWKIVLATNVAETSLTIEDVTHVVDCGFVKEMRYDPMGNLSTLQEVHLSRASARQRAGRAGRVTTGHCWRLYTETFLMHHPGVADHPVPEIQRIPLEEIILQVLILRLGTPEAFLSRCVEPPRPEHIRSAIATLIEIQAILPQNQTPLTALGYHLARIPVDVRLGKMLVYGCLLQCIEPVLTMVAALSSKSPFLTQSVGRSNPSNPSSHQAFHFQPSSSSSSSSTKSLEKQTRPQDSTEEGRGTEGQLLQSDHLAIVQAYQQWQSIREGGADGGGGIESSAALQFCKEHGLSHSLLEDMRQLRDHFRSHLIRSNLIHDLSNLIQDGTGSDGEKGIPWNLLRCVLCAGLYPQVARLSQHYRKVTDGKRTRKLAEDSIKLKLTCRDHTEVHMHPSSLLARTLSQAVDSNYGRQKNDEQNRFKKQDLSFEPFSGKDDLEMEVHDCFVVYHKKVELQKKFLFDGTVIPHDILLLFSNGDLKLNRKRDRVIIDGWIEINTSEVHTALLKQVQLEIDKLLITKVENPSRNIAARIDLIRDTVETICK